MKWINNAKTNRNAAFAISTRLGSNILQILYIRFSNYPAVLSADAAPTALLDVRNGTVVYNQGRHIQTRMWATSATAVNPRKPFT